MAILNLFHREKKYRQTRTAVKATVAEADNASGLPSDIELQPEHEVLHQELTEQRKKLLRELDSRSVKSVSLHQHYSHHRAHSSDEQILVDLTAAMSRINRDSDPEKALLKEAIAEVRQLVTDQGI